MNVFKAARNWLKFRKTHAEEVKVIKVELKEGKLNIWLEHPIMAQIATSFIRFWDDQGGINWVGFEVFSPIRGAFEVVIQRLNRPTAAQMVDELTNALAGYVYAHNEIEGEIVPCHCPVCLKAGDVLIKLSQSAVERNWPKENLWY